MSKRAPTLTYMNLSLSVAPLVRCVVVYPRPYTWAIQYREGQEVQVFGHPVPWPPPRALEGDGATSEPAT